MGFPVFASGDVLNASDMNAVGLWLIRSQTVGSGVGSVTLSNVFSADYDNYRIIYSGGTLSTADTLPIQLQNSGGTSTTQYYTAYSGLVWTSGAAATYRDNNGPSWFVGGGGDTGYVNICVDILQPFGTRFTTINGTYIGTDNAGAFAGIHRVSASYTNLVIDPATATMTGGTIRVYGYRN